jgi:hypothetical protein
LLIVLLATSAQGQTIRVSANQGRVGRCIEHAAQGRQWLARTLWGLYDQEGGWTGAAVRAANGSEDLGPLQVNSAWVDPIASALGRSSADVRRWLQHDTCFNVDAARWIFVTGFAAGRGYWTAVGRYHSPVDWRARRYAASVAVHLRRRYGPSIFARPDVR